MASRKPKTSARSDTKPVLPDWRCLFGHDQVIRRWRELLQLHALPQVILLSGRAGIGKRSLLAALAALDACTSRAACGSCESCLWLLCGTHPEVLWVDPGEQRLTLEDAARVQDHLSFCAEGGRGARVAVIVDADRLTHQAANRLLKILEEPPLGSRIFLSTSRVDAMLPTILSRCVRWRIDPPSAAVSLDWLRRELDTKDHQLARDEERLMALLKRAGQSPGVALALVASGRELLELQEDFWSPSGIPQALAAAAEAAGNLGNKAPGASSLAQGLDEWEIELNAYYRKLLAQSVAVDPRIVHRRRKILQAVRAKALRSKVPLNPLLTAEGVALAAILATK